MRTLLPVIFLLLLPFPSLSHPLCTDSSAPITLNATLKFCGYSGKSCCNSAKDSELEKQFQAMNISDSTCAALVKPVLCARCDQFSGELFTVDSSPRPVPILCNSTKNDFCSKIYDTCQNISIFNSPFAPLLQSLSGTSVNSSITKVTDLWQSKTDFCNSFGGSSTEKSLCFNGDPVKIDDVQPPIPPHGLCLEKIGNGTYLNMAPHPDGSNRAFFSNQAGKIWLATLPEQGSGGIIEVDESSPFLDLTDQVHLDTQFGMMGMAFHPNFAQNGRIFASFNCDKVKWPECSGRCSCNSDVNCDPSKLSPDNGASPCQYQTVIAEYSANASGSSPSSVKNAKPSEVRRIFTMGLPFTSHHGGQILFGPSDGYLYLMMGDGGGNGDPYNLSQNKKSLLGKIMRLDVDNMPSASEVDKLALWGNYSIPKDNPFTNDPDSQHEIWALGMRNPWRCSFDSERPSYFMCGDVGQDTFEEVDIITKGGNYGWRSYEGPYEYSLLSASGGNTSLEIINTILPVMGYNHSEVNNNKSASITGGYFYRGPTDPCTYGMYLYADLYAGAIWAGIEDPENSGNFTENKIPFSCTNNSPIQCSSVPGSDLPALSYIFSFAEDNQKDMYLLSNNGVYRIVRPSRCKYTCSKENATATLTPSPTGAPPSRASTGRSYNLVIVFGPLFLILMCIL